MGMKCFFPVTDASTSVTSQFIPLESSNVNDRFWKGWLWMRQSLRKTKMAAVMCRAIAELPPIIVKFQFDLRSVCHILPGFSMVTWLMRAKSVAHCWSCALCILIASWCHPRYFFVRNRLLNKIKKYCLKAQTNAQSPKRSCRLCSLMTTPIIVLVLLLLSFGRVADGSNIGWN